MSEENDDNVIKELRAKADEAKQVPGLQRQLAFAKAGIDYESGHGKVLFQMHDGDLTTEAIMATAKDLNLTVTGTAEPSTPVENASTAEERAALEQIQQASQSTEPASEGLGPDPWQEARDAMKTSQQNGEPIEWQHAAAISRIVAADNRNDPRVRGKGVSDELVQQAQSA